MASMARSGVYGLKAMVVIEEGRARGPRTRQFDHRPPRGGRGQREGASDVEWGAGFSPREGPVETREGPEGGHKSKRGGRGALGPTNSTTDPRDNSCLDNTQHCLT